MKVTIKHLDDGRFVLLDPRSQITDKMRRNWMLYLPDDGRVILLSDDRKLMISVEMKDILNKMLSQYGEENGINNEADNQTRPKRR